MPQQLINIPVRSRTPLVELPRTNKLIRSVEQALASEGRVLVRYSGTENKARIMVEGPDAAKTKTWAEEIAAEMQREIGGA